MGKVVVILAVIATGLGVTSLHLVNQLREGDARIAELQTQVASLQAQAAAPRPAATFSIMPGPVVDQAIKESPPAPKEAPKTAQGQVGAVASMVPAPPSREETIRMMREHRERQRQLMQDPEYREAMRIQARSNFGRQYPGVVQELELDRQQAEEFFEMLADQQQRATEQMEPLWQAEGDNSDPTAMQARHRKLQQMTVDMQRKNEAEIAARFGQNKLDAWKEYQSTVGQRYQLEHMRSMLAAQGVPLGDDVSKPMLKALASVQKAEMDEYAAAAKRGAAPVLAARMVANNSFQSAGFNMEQQIESTRKRNQRTLDAISPYLSFEQRSAIEKEQEAQLKMMEVQQRLMRARDNGTPNSRFYSEGEAVMMLPTAPQ